MTYKLTYFPVRGRGEAARILLNDNNIKFEDDVLQNLHETWPKVKPTTPFGQLPCLTDGTLLLAQSGAILRHLARKHGLYGDSVTEAALIDMTHEAQEDLRGKCTKMLYSDYENGKNAFIESLPGLFSNLENLLKKNNGGTGFFVGEKISFADYSMFDLLNMLLALSPECLKDFPALKAFHERMAQRDGIKKYQSLEEVKNRPFTGSGHV